LIVAKSMNEVNKLKILLSREFDMKDLDVAKNILGMEIRRDKTTKRLRLSQCNYVKKVLERFNMYNAKLVSTPLANHFRLSIVQCSKIDDDEKDMSKISYASVVRCLMYISSYEMSKLESVWMFGCLAYMYISSYEMSKLDVKFR